MALLLKILKQFLLYYIILRKDFLKNTSYIGEIIDRVKKNDILAQRILYETFAKEMLLLSSRMTANNEAAKDILQESFICAFQNINKLKEILKFRAWLKRIVINNCLKHLKDKEYFQDIDTVSDIIDDCDDEWFKKVSLEQITQQINQLPEGCRQIFTLYLFEDYKHKEIAQLLNITESTSKSQYQRALKLLQQKLKIYLP